MFRSLIYSREVASGLETLVEMNIATPGLAMLRALTEHSIRIEWASHGRWDEYWAWEAKKRYHEIQKAVRLHPNSREPDSEAMKELRAMAESADPMPETLIDVLKQNMESRSRDEDPATRNPDWSQDDAMGIYYSLIQNDLHPSAHGRALSFLSEPSRDDTKWWALFAYHLIAEGVVAAAHRVMNWSRVPISCVYNRVVHMAEDPLESSLSDEDCYGDLGLDGV